MDRRSDWPWSWEEEAEWKADLEERDHDFVDQMIYDAVEDGMTRASYVIGSRREQEAAEDNTPEKYLVAA